MKFTLLTSDGLLIPKAYSRGEGPSGTPLSPSLFSSATLFDIFPIIPEKCHPEKKRLEGEEREE